MSLEREITHSIWQELEDGAGSLHILLTISGTTASETISDLTSYEENPKERQAILDRYVSDIYLLLFIFVFFYRLLLNWVCRFLFS